MSNILKLKVFLLAFYILFLSQVFAFVSLSTDGFGRGKIWFAAIECDEKNMANTNKITLSLIRLLIKLWWITFLNYVIKIYV